MSNIAALMDLLFPGTLGRELDKLTTTGLLLRIEQGNQVRYQANPSCLFTDLAAICAHLAAHGWLYADGDAQHYGTPRALFPLDLLAWVQTNCALTEGIVCAWSDHSSWIQDRASLCGVQHLRLGADAGNRLTLLTHHRHRVGLEIFGKATT